ncbi:MAG: prepilin-type N-terminal cleavage/methylation domain-containing protein [Planctomycetes bacterium]|nr:prepilin-type N-terminal cleavage/methylation domain-containing protein [Planctomycetota bacterium]
MKSCRSDGYTLLELMVAMGLLVFLGGGLASLLSYGVATWHEAETRGRVYEQARAVLERIAEDLRSACVRSHAAEGDSWVRFLCDADAGGRQRLRLVRAISGEAADPVLREGGRYLSVRTPAAADGRDDAGEASEGLLAAPAGTMEVLYAQDPRPGKRTLWRGFRAPVGGPDSLLIDKNVEEPPAVKSEVRKALPVAAEKSDGALAPGTEPPEPRPEDVFLSRVAAPIAEGVLFLGLSFWTPATNTWAPVPPKQSPRPGEPSGPSPWWDSTRALLETQGAAGDLVWKPRPGSLEDPRDDLFPERVEVTLVLAAGGGGGALGLRFAEDVAEGAKTLPLTAELELPEDPLERFVLVDDEWIEVDAAEGRTLSVKQGGRGARLTRPARHDRGAPVELGTTFRRTIEMPGFRSEEREEPAERRAGRRRGTR